MGNRALLLVQFYALARTVAASGTLSSETPPPGPHQEEACTAGSLTSPRRWQRHVRQRQGLVTDPSLAANNHAPGSMRTSAHLTQMARTQGRTLWLSR